MERPTLLGYLLTVLPWRIHDMGGANDIDLASRGGGVLRHALRELQHLGMGLEGLGLGLDRPRHTCKWYISHPVPRHTLPYPLLSLLFARFPIVFFFPHPLVPYPCSLP